VTGRLPDQWWNSRTYLWVLVALATVPLLIPPVPPLTDLPAHLARYRIALGGGPADPLSQWYEFHWALVGNLGVDGIVHMLAPSIGLQLATKLTVLAIPPLTVLGMLLVAREAHGRMPPTAAFAVPLAYGFPFLFGFVNFCLAMALMLLALALWIRLGRQERMRTRAVLFVPISIAIYFAHIVGWGVLGLCCLAVETAYRRSQGHSFAASVLSASKAVLPLAVPFVFLLLWRSGGGGEDSLGWFQLETKFFALSRILSDRWFWFDLACLLILIRVAVLPVAKRNRIRVSPLLAAPAAALGIIVLLLPHQLFGSSFADSRLAGFALAIWLLALDGEEREGRRAHRLALAATAFALVRILAVSVSLMIESRAWNGKLLALDRVRPGSRVASLVHVDCDDWPISRSTHLGSFAVTRRDSFSNDQWSVAGSRLLTINYPAAGLFAADPSQVVTTGACVDQGWPTSLALSRLPANAFDYLWLIDMPAGVRDPDGWRAVAGSGESRLLVRQAIAKDRIAGSAQPANP
jgi:hypothetical protein